MTSTKNNFEFLVEYITTKVVEMLIKDRKIGLEEALLLFHNSETFEKLCDRKTDMYIESPGYLYEIFQEELRRGTIRGVWTSNWFRNVEKIFFIQFVCCINFISLYIQKFDYLCKILLRRILGL